MAKFLSTTGVSHELEELIKSAEERLVLISPFLRVNQRIRDLLADKERMKIDMRVVYGKSELSPEQSEWLLSTPSIRTSYCANLHAKCYLNEKKALLTSMNLYEFSQVNNIEMGVLVDRTTDETLYEAILEEALRIVRGSEEHLPTPTATTAATPQGGGTRPKPRTRAKAAVGKSSGAAGDQAQARRADTSATTAAQPPQSGFCIRCRGELTADPMKPYCLKCYRSYARQKENGHEEKHCHLCGETHRVRLERPVCQACYRKHKKAFSFPAAKG